MKQFGSTDGNQDVNPVPAHPNPQQELAAGSTSRSHRGPAASGLQSGLGMTGVDVAAGPRCPVGCVVEDGTQCSRDPSALINISI